MPRPIAYLMSRFPHLPETFILREMNGLEQRGWALRLYPLMVQQQSIIHADAERWVPRAQRTPWVSGALLKAQATTLVRHPARSVGTWLRTLAGYQRAPSELVRALALLPKAPLMARRMQQEGVAHIHAHYATYPALIAWAIHRLTGISYSVTVHAHDIFVSQAMLAPKLRDAAFVVAISAYNREFLRRHAGADVAAKAQVIHCGIAAAQYQPATPQRRSVRLELISTGSLQPYKGFAYLIDACAQLRDQGLDFRCRIIGGGEDEPTLRAQIAALKLEAQVELLGPQKETAVRELLAAADCYVQPSVITASGKMEGIPVALMEALATGLPVVATAISGIPELVRPFQTGLLVPPADAAALATALNFMATQPRAAAQMAAAGRALVAQDFNLETTVAQLAQAFTAVAPAAAPAPLVVEAR